MRFFLNWENNTKMLLCFFIQSDIQYQEKTGNLFDTSSEECLGQCVCPDVLRWEREFATQFKLKFKNVSDLKEQGKGVGEVAVLQDGTRYIYYLITKERYYHKPAMDSLKSSLITLKTHMTKNNMTLLSMPCIGCGLDRLNWQAVKKLIKEVFTDTGIQVTP